METTNIAIDSSSAEDNLCRLEHVSSTDRDRVLDEGLKRALEKTCNIETPATKKQKKKESWAFCEAAKVFMPTPLTSELPKSNAISRLGGLAGDTRRAMLAEMLQEASELAQAIGKLDPDPELPDGRRRTIGPTPSSSIAITLVRAYSSPCSPSQVHYGMRKDGVGLHPRNLIALSIVGIICAVASPTTIVTLFARPPVAA
jgi:hypothetical protein